MSRGNAVTRYRLSNADLVSDYFRANEIDSISNCETGICGTCCQWSVINGGRRGSRAAMALPAEEDGWWAARGSEGGRGGGKELEAVAGDEAHRAAGHAPARWGQLRSCEEDELAY
jgi:hypothetical protein